MRKHEKQNQLGRPNLGWDNGSETELNSNEFGTVVSSCEHGNEHQVSAILREFID
jgi:hypothetical protein